MDLLPSASLVLCVLMLAVGATGQGPSSYLVSLGSTEPVEDSSGRTWAADPFLQGTPMELSPPGTVLNGTVAADPRVYSRGVFVDAPGVLAFNLSVRAPGRHWLRLHFAAFPTARHPDPARARFNATAGGVLLLSNYSVVADSYLQNGGAGLYGGVLKEFSLPIASASSPLSLTIAPIDGSHAFISALEFLPMPEDLYNARVYALALSSGSQQPQAPVDLPPALAWATQFRVHCGSGGLVPPGADALTRTWAEDPPFQNGVGNWPALTHPDAIGNPNASPLFIPNVVGRSARELGGDNAVAANLSFAFRVPRGANYLVRLVFCENEYPQAFYRLMNLYVNGRAVLTGVDVLRDDGYHRAAARTFLVPLPTLPPGAAAAGDGGEGELIVDIGPSVNSQVQNPMVSGFEILRAGTSALAGPSSSLELPPVESPAAAPAPTRGGGGGGGSGVNGPPGSSNGSGSGGGNGGGGGGGGSSGAAIGGGVAGAVAALALVAFLIVCCMRKQRHRQESFDRKKGAGSGGGRGSGGGGGDGGKEGEGDEEWAPLPLHNSHSVDMTKMSSRATSVAGTSPAGGLAGGGGKGREFVGGSGGGAGQHKLFVSNDSHRSSVTSGGSEQTFSFQELWNATRGFDDAMLLGEGGFGKVYRGTLTDGRSVAVKRGSPEAPQGLAEFQTEIRVLTKLRHRHLVSLIGFCEEHDEMILIYDFMANGPLRAHLYGGTQLAVLTWRQRVDICIGAARGLHYLHTGAHENIIHRDVKSTNILLDDNFVAKMADFGLSKFGPTLNQTHVSTVVKGSFGYLDPEYYRRQQLTEKSDVYSFGVVLLEVLCARPPINPTLPREEANIVDWAASHVQMGNVGSVIDPRLAGTYSMPSVDHFVQLALSCLHDDGSQRPNMGTVLFALEQALQLQVSSAEVPINTGSNTDGHARQEVATAGTDAFSETVDRSSVTDEGRNVYSQ